LDKEVPDGMRHRPNRERERERERENHLLAALLDAGLQRLSPQLERVVMPRGQILGESGYTQNNLYFPTSAIVSLMYVTEDGATTEIAVVGNEGVVGISQFLGTEPQTPKRWCKVPARASS
jgi:hypothetical protein